MIVQNYADIHRIDAHVYVDVPEYHTFLLSSACVLRDNLNSLRMHQSSEYLKTFLREHAPKPAPVEPASAHHMPRNI